MTHDRSIPTSPDIARMTSPLLVVPLGSWEQHGPHLPLDTDTRIAEELVARLVRRTAAVRGPTLTVSSSGEHAGFPGTLSIGTRVVFDMLVELVRSADWANGVVIVNGHGGNNESLLRATSLLEREGHEVLAWSPSLVDPRDSHAGYVETSVMLAIDASEVRLDEIAAAPAPVLHDVLDDLRRHGVASVSPSGVLGDPRRADATLGQRLLAEWENQLATAVSAWRSRNQS